MDTSTVLTFVGIGLVLWAMLHWESLVLTIIVLLFIGIYLYACSVYGFWIVTCFTAAFIAIMQFCNKVDRVLNLAEAKLERE